jgi:hypothetical protein
MISLATAINATGNASAVKPEAGHDAASNGVDENAADKHGEEEGDERAGQKRKRYITVVENGKKRKMVDQVRFFILDFQSPKSLQLSHVVLIPS